jgi:hypothetical protein
MVAGHKAVACWNHSQHQSEGHSNVLVVLPAVTRDRVWDETKSMSGIIA